ncbi:MAG: hypothetical protein NC082_03520 [Clostridiales bacterium]|nr:hypothetical protein [Clostridiales bacterium]
MKPFSYISHFLTVTVATVLLVVMTVACSDGEEPRIPDAGGTPRQVGFTITVADVPDMGNLSRATPAGPYDPGSGYENYIDIAGKDFRFLFFDVSNKYVGQIEINSFIPISINPLNSSKTYSAMGSLPADIATGYKDFKVCVLANWASYPVLEKGDDLSKLWDASSADNMFTFNEEPLSSRHTVPLYGIQEYSGITFEPDVQFNMGRIHLLRAYAKVEVILLPNVRGVESLAITRVNGRGYKAPCNVDELSDYVHNSYDQDYVALPHIPALADEDIVTDYKMRWVSGDDGEERRFIAYVPEYDNTSDGAVKTYIKVNYEENGYDPGHKIEFKYYQATGSHGKDTPFDLLRNYWYRFTVNGGPSTITVDVQPYALVTLRPDFGLERDEDGNIIIRDQNGNIVKVIMLDKTVLKYEPFTIPNIGESTGVFDENNHVLMAYLEDGRQIVYNYCDESRTELMSWEIYSSERDNGVLVHLEEEYIKSRYNWETKKFEDEFHHNFYDDGGCLVERYIYPNHGSFENRPSNGESSDAVKTVRYEGELFGDKTVYHYNYNSVTKELKLFLKVTIVKKAVTDDDGNISYVYEETYEPVQS